VRTKNGWIAAVAAGWVGVLLAGAGPASAAPQPVSGRDTRISVTGSDDLEALGIALTSNAPVDGVDRLVFNITGGIFDVLFFDGTLEHFGLGMNGADVGVKLIKDATTVALTRFVIDTTGTDPLLNATATVTVGANAPQVIPDLPLFTLTLCPFPAIYGVCVNNDGSYQIDGYGLLVTTDAASAIGEAFDLDASSLAGSQFGIANIAIRVVPEPGTLALAGLGLAGLCARARRRAA
jgi:hypothetical protein